MTNKKDAGKEQEQVEFKTINQNRVVLNLTTEQAQVLSKACMDARLNTVFVENQELLKKISGRIDRTILKQAFIQRCINDGIGKPNKEQMKNFREQTK